MSAANQVSVSQAALLLRASFQVTCAPYHIKVTPCASTLSQNPLFRPCAVSPAESSGIPLRTAWHELPSQQPAPVSMDSSSYIARMVQTV
jgi:hypothetical protein